MLSDLVLQVRVCARNARNGKLKAKFYADGWPDFTTVVCVIFFPTITEVSILIQSQGRRYRGGQGGLEPPHF